MEADGMSGKRCQMGLRIRRSLPRAATGSLVLAMLVSGSTLAAQPIWAKSSAAPIPPGLSAAQRREALSLMTPRERELRKTHFNSSRWVILGYSRISMTADGGASLATTVTPSTRTVQASPEPSTGSGIEPLASSDYVYNGLDVYIDVEWDTSIHGSYHYDIVSSFDWQGSTQPFNGVAGDDGMAVYWGNNLALYSEYFWGNYRDGTSLQDISHDGAPPNSGDAWSFWEAKNNCCSVANFGYLDVTAIRSNYTNTWTNFNVKYIHSWANYSYSFAWGAGPSVSFTPSTSTKPISTGVPVLT